jgi:hypothetical protein
MADENNLLNSGQRNVSGPNTGISSSGGKVFEIHVRGQLDNRWLEWLGGLQVNLLDDGEMILYGAIVDQAALMGVLIKLNRLNLPLISVNEVKSKNINGS